MTVFLNDSFDDRATTPGWGTPTTGPGPWQILSSAVNGLFSVNMGAGRGEAALTSSQDTGRAWIPTSSWQDIEVLTHFSILTGSTANQFVDIIARSPDGTSGYRIGTKYTSSGMLIGAEAVNGTSSPAIGSLLLSTVAANIGDTYGMRIQVVGTNPTIINIKLWNNSGSEPSDYQLSLTDNSLALAQGPGAFTFYFNMSGTTSTAAVYDVNVSTGILSSHTTKTFGIDLLKSKSNRKTVGIDVNVTTNDSDVSAALQASDIAYKGRLLMYLNQNRYLDPTVTTTEASPQNIDILSDGVTQPGMQFAFTDYGSTVDGGFRLLDTSNDTLNQVPYIGSLSTIGGSVSETIIIKYDSAIKCNMIDFGMDPFLVADPNRVGQITNMAVDISFDGTNYNTIFSGDPGAVEEFKLWLDSSDGLTWLTAQNTDNVASIFAIRVTINSIATNGIEARFVTMYEIGPFWILDVSDDIISFDIKKDRDTQSVTLLPVGISAANSLTLVLDNTTNNYNNNYVSSPYYHKLTPNVKFNLELGVQLLNDSIDYFQQGIFYVDSWAISEDTSQVTVELRDRSKVLQSTIMPSVLYEGLTPGEAIVDVIQRAGITDYIIDDSIFSASQLAIGKEVKIDNTGTTSTSEDIPNIFWNNGGSTGGITHQTLTSSIRLTSTAVSSTTIWQFLTQLATTDLGVFYFDEDEVFIYKTKEAVDNTDDVTFFDNDIDESTNLLTADYTSEINFNDITLDYEIPTMSTDPVSLFEAPSPTVLSSTALASSIDSNDTTIDVGDISDWLPSGFFKIGDEIIEYDSKPIMGQNDDGSFIYTRFDDCTRGVLGTTAGSHVPKTNFVTNDIAWQTNALAGDSWVLSSGVLQSTHTLDSTLALAWFPVDHTSRYIYSGQFKINASPWRVKIPVRMVPATPTQNYYYVTFIVNPDPVGDPLAGASNTNNIGIHRVYNGVDTTLITVAATSMYQTQWHTWKLTVNNFMFTVNVDGADQITQFVDLDMQPNSKTFNKTMYNIFTGSSYVGLGNLNDGIDYGTQPSAEFDNLVLETIGENSTGNQLLFTEGFGTSIYEVRHFDINYNQSPAKNINFFMTEKVKAELIFLNTDPFTADAYILNLVDGLTLIEGPRPETTLQGVDEFFVLSGNAVTEDQGQTVEVLDDRSIQLYGKNTTSVSLPWVQSRIQAINLVEYLLEVYKIPTSFITASIIPDPRMKLGQIVSMTYERLALDLAPYWITNIEINYQTNAVSQTITLRSKATASYPV